MKPRYAKLLGSIVALLLLAGLAACSRQPQDPPAADGAFLQTLVDRDLARIPTGGNLVNCQRTNTHVAGQYALIEVSCDNGERLEYAYYASKNQVYRRHVFYSAAGAPLATEEQIMTAVGAPQMEAWMLADKRDHFRFKPQGK